MTQAITLAVAMLGAVLGIINTWMVFWRDRVRVRVNLQGWMDSTGATGIGVEVVNIGRLPVTIKDIRFKLPGLEDKNLIFDPRVLQGPSMPKRLEPFASFAVRIDARVTAKYDYTQPGVRALAITACGRRFFSRRSR